MRLAAAAGLALGLWAGAVLAAPGHSDCSACHVGEPAAGTLAAPLETLCVTCHEDRLRPQRDHRVGLPVYVPTRLPLLEGKVACTSCHDWHLEPRRSLWLPREELCEDCHR